MRSGRATGRCARGRTSARPSDRTMRLPFRPRSHTVADIIRGRIETGDIQPGTHLMEIPLAEELGVSRTPVHDALTRLAEEGWLIAKPNRGFIVRRFDVKDVFDAFSVRATLEGMGCRLVGERGLEAGELKDLQDLLERQAEALEREPWDVEAINHWQELNLQFHYGLLELADNRWLADAVRRSRKLPVVVDRRSRRHDEMSFRLLYQRHQSRQALAEHRQILHALSRREVTRAEALMREHVLVNRDVLVRHLLEEEPSETQTVTQREATCARPPDSSN